jgi:4-deoxy-L-threo-5-hexosulose-uronate ketol-isomerase
MIMTKKFEHSAQETSRMNTGDLREHFLIQGLMKDDEITLVYSYHDRMVIGGAKPVQTKLQLEAPGEFKAAHFLERRELGIINTGNKGTVAAGGKNYELNNLDCLYLGKDTRDIAFSSADPSKPACFYLVSVPAHVSYPVVHNTREHALPAELGSQATGNMRTLYKYIHPGGIKSCQLVMGLTVIKEGSVWNSVPPHTHTRRSEVYFYFDLAEEHRIFHFMGEPGQTRHIVCANNEAVISPPWSVHFGCGTSNYGFIWAMAGENQAFDDMDQAPVNTLL